MRDQLLHHYIRGLRLKAQKRPQEAAAAFQRAIYSTTSGYVRLNLELGRTYLELDRPADAAAILEAALRGPTGATGMYASRTELQYVLGQAYEQLGDGARAAMQYRRVLHAWEHADPELASRRELVRQRLAALATRKSGPRRQS